MTDRAKKISELQATTSVANTDKLVVLKDPAGTPLTRSVTANVFALSIRSLILATLPNSTFIANTSTIVSDGTNYVNAFSYSIVDYDAAEIVFHATENNNITIGRALIVANSTTSNAFIDSTLIGSNPIIFDGTIALSSNTVTLQLKRNSASTANISMKYTALFL